METSVGHSTVLADLLLLGGEIHGKISESHGHQLIVSLLLHYNKLVGSYAK